METETLIKILMLVLTYALNIFDLCVTNMWVKKYGIEIEANPVGKWLYGAKWRMTTFKIILPAIVFVVLAVVGGTVTRVCTNILAIAYIALAIYHVYIINKMKKLGM